MKYKPINAPEVQAAERKLRAAAIDFGQHVKDEPIDDRDSACARRNNKLMVAACNLVAARLAAMGALTDEVMEAFRRTK